MNSQIQTYQASQTVEVTNDLELIELEEGLFLFNRTVSSKVVSKSKGGELKSSGNDLPSSHSVGAVNAKGKGELMAGKLPSRKNTRNLMWLSRDWIEKIRLFGFYVVAEMIHKEYEKDKSLYDVWAQFVSNPKRDLDELVELDYSSHTIGDRHGNALPVGILFDYIKSQIDESSYDLPKLFEYLSSRQDVLVLRGDWDLGDKPQDWKAAGSFRKAVFEIPYYNAEPGRNTSIQFIWQPSVEAYRKVLGKDLSVQHWKILQEDVLGIKQFQYD